MPRDVRTRRVKDMSQPHSIPKEVLNKLLSELALHEGIGCNLPNEPRADFVRSCTSCQVKKPLHKRNRESVSTRGRRIPILVVKLFLFILNRDIWRVPHNRMVALSTQQVILRGVPVVVLSIVAVLLTGRGNKIPRPRNITTVNQGVPCGHNDRPFRVAFFQGSDTALSHSSHEKAKAGDGDRIRVLVHSMHALKAAADQVPVGRPCLRFTPLTQQTVESPQKEVSRSAGWVDQTEPLLALFVRLLIGLVKALTIKTKLFDSRLQRVVENELLNEVRGLQ